MKLAGSEAPSLVAAQGRILERADPSSPLDIRGLSVTYGEKPVVFSIDFTVPAGEMVAIVGPNGAGKSTLIKAALGIVPRLSGEISVFGRSLASQRRRVAYVPQRSSVDWDFPARVLDVVTMGLYADLGLLGMVRAQHRDRALACIHRVGLTGFEQRQIGQLSGGQQQRVFLARALAQSADLYVMDEPFAGVDAATERAIVGVLKELQSEGRTVLAVHHDLATVPDYFGHVLLINVRKIASGRVADVFTSENLQATYGGRLALQQLADLQSGRVRERGA